MPFRILMMQNQIFMPHIVVVVLENIPSKHILGIFQAILFWEYSKQSWFDNIPSNPVLRIFQASCKFAVRWKQTMSASVVARQYMLQPLKSNIMFMARQCMSQPLKCNVIYIERQCMPQPLKCNVIYMKRQCMSQPLKCSVNVNVIYAILGKTIRLNPSKTSGVTDLQCALH